MQNLIYLNWSQVYVNKYEYLLPLKYSNFSAVTAYTGTCVVDTPQKEILKSV